MPKYRVGERIVVGLVEVIVVRGNCESCFFNKHNTGDFFDFCMAGLEKSCIEEIGSDTCFKVLREGL